MVRAKSQYGHYEIPQSKEVKLLSKRFGKLYREGQKMDCAYILLDGEVTLAKKNELGKNIPIESVKVGDILGLHALQNSGRSTHSIRIKRSSKFLAIQLTSISTYLEQLPAFRHAVVHQLIDHLDAIDGMTALS